MSIQGQIYKFFNKNNVKTLFLIDILYMKDINAIYSFKNGDYIISQLRALLKKTITRLITKQLKRKVLIELTNLHADVFSLKLYDDLTQDEINTIRKLIFKKIINYDFKLKKANTTINIDITIGCSKSKDNMLRVYTEKALHNAKLNGIHFMYYDANLYKNESVNETIIDILTYNINEKMVEPFFQAIMDNQTDKIIKYEALMRLFDREGNILSPILLYSKQKKQDFITNLWR